MNQEQGLQQSDFPAVPLFYLACPHANSFYNAYALFFPHSLLGSFSAPYSLLQGPGGIFILVEGSRHQTGSEENAGNGAFLLEFADSVNQSSLGAALISAQFYWSVVASLPSPLSFPCFTSILDRASFPKLSKAMKPSQPHSPDPVFFLEHFLQSPL